MQIGYKKVIQNFPACHCNFLFRTTTARQIVCFAFASVSPATSFDLVIETIWWGLDEAG